MASGAWGMGHGAWGMGHGAWGMRHEAVHVPLKFEGRGLFSFRDLLGLPVMHPVAFRVPARSGEVVQACFGVDP